MTAIFIKILNMSISASWIVLAVLILRLLLKKAPKWITVVLWGLVALKLVLPFSIESAFSLIPSAEAVDPEIIVNYTPETEVKLPIDNETASPVINETGAPTINETVPPMSVETVPPVVTVPSSPSVTVPPVVVVPPVSNVTVPTVVNETNPPVFDVTAPPVVNETEPPIISDIQEPKPAKNTLQTVMTVIAIVWVVGIAAMVIYTSASYYLLRKKIDTAFRLRDNVYQSENIESPFVLGIIKPKIYLPFNIKEQAAEYVIAHENAHIKRLDYIWKPIGFILLTVYWFNPVMWIAYVFLCRDIELACDEKVIAGFDSEQRADYSEALLSCSVNRKVIAACPIAFGEVGVKDRIKSVLNYKKPALWIIILAVVAIIATALCFLTDPISEKESEEGTEETEESTKQDPLEILEELEYKLEKPSEELKNKFAEEYIAYKGYDSKNPPTVAIECWLGSYGDIGFLLVYDSQMKFPTGGTRTERVADSKFDYPYGQSILVWADNQFLSLDEAWRKVIITTRMITKIEEVYKQKQYIEVYDYSTLDPSVTEYRLEMPTRAVRERFAGEYSAYMKTIYPDSNISGYIKCWLGSFGNIGFVWAFEGVSYAQMLTTEVVADSKFEYSDSHTIKVWVDGKFLSITKAYEQNLITKEMVAKIAEAWAKKQFLEVVEGTTPNYPPVLQEPEKQPETPEKFSYANYYDFLIGLCSNNPEKIASFFVKDLDNNGVDELIVDPDSSMEYSFYTIDNGVVKLIEKYDFLTGTTRLLETNDEAYPGLICFTVGGGANHYVYLTIKDGQLSFEKIWDDNYSGTYDTPTTEYTTDKKLIEVSANAYNKNQDVARTDIALVAVLYSQKPYIDEEGKSVYLKDYKFQNTANMSPEEYTSVDMDNDGVNELIVNIAHQDVIISVMVFRVYNGEVYGYEFVLRALKAIKTDGSFSCSESAFITSTHKLEFEGTSYKVVELEYSNSIDNVYRLNGVNVTKAETETFESEWNKIPQAVWAKWQNGDSQNQRDIGQMQTETQSIITIDGKRYQTYVASNADIRYIFISADEYPTPVEWIWDWVAIGTANEYSLELIGKVDEGRIAVDLLLVNYFKTKYEEYKDQPYVIVDLDSDGTDEMVVNASVGSGFVMVFRFYNGKVYSYEFKTSELKNLKKDCSFMQGSSNYLNSVSRLEFEGTSCKFVEIAYRDLHNNVYRLNGAAVSKEELEKFDEERNKIPGVNWVVYSTLDGTLDYETAYVNFVKDSYRVDYNHPQTYAIKDLNKDGVPELLFWNSYMFEVYVFESGAIKIVDYSQSSLYHGPTDVLENGAILYKNTGTGHEYCYQTLNADNTVTKLFFEEIWWSENETLYKFDGKNVSKDEWEALTKPYFDISKAQIEWKVYEHEFYVDLNFDSKLDKLVPHERSAYAVFYKAYVWNEAKGDYIYAPSFELFSNVSIDTERKVLLAHFSGGMTTSYSMFTYNGEDFESTHSLYWSFVENGKTQLKEQEYVVETGSFERKTLERKNINIDKDYLQLYKTDEQLKGYFESGSFWDLDGARWKNYVYNMDTSDWWKF